MFASDWFGPSIYRAPAGRKQVAVTFDDGPSESTPAVLDVLRAYNARATFFLVGMNTLRLPAGAREILHAGHEVGNHTHTHANFYQSAPWTVSREITRAQRTIEDTLGVAPTWFRPPYGVRWFGMFPALRKLQLRCGMWSLDTCDWRDPADLVLAQATKTRDGDVLLLHDGFRTHTGDHRKETVKALPRILALIQESGYETVTLSEMFPNSPAAAT